MEIISVSEKLGKSIIAKEHEFFIKESIDNLDHILSLKRIIEGITDYLKSNGVAKEELTDLILNLKSYGKELFIEGWLATTDEEEKEENIEEVKNEAAKHFDYIYKNEKHPK